jgi:hypothetical protein
MNPQNVSATEPVAYRQVPDRRLRQLAPGAIPPIGAHLVTPAFGFAHHGIYAGSGRVIHYGALMYDIIRKPVEEVSFDGFAEGRAVFVVEHGEGCIEPEVVIRRARTRLGEKHYRLFTNNCEHFVEWCLHDVSRSFQAETALAYPRMVGERIEGAILGFIRRVWAVFRPALRAEVRAPLENRAPARVRVEDRSEPRE